MGANVKMEQALRDILDITNDPDIDATDAMYHIGLIAEASL